MNRIDLHFLLLATVMLLAGVTLGIVMGATQNMQFTPIHAHLNLAGWASLALFGLTYRAYPELAARKLAKVHFALSGISAVLLPFGIYLAVFEQSETLAIASAMAWLAGAALFLLQLLTLVTARGRAPVATPAE